MAVIRPQKDPRLGPVMFYKSTDPLDKSGLSFFCYQMLLFILSACSFRPSSSFIKLLFQNKDRRVCLFTPHLIMLCLNLNGPKTGGHEVILCSVKIGTMLSVVMSKC